MARPNLPACNQRPARCTSHLALSRHPSSQLDPPLSANRHHPVGVLEASRHGTLDLDGVHPPLRPRPQLRPS